ncbi:MAG: 3-isopropylmalate dehydratase large subunit [Candidatus Margulisiibacteriota bacterium]
MAAKTLYNHVWDLHKVATLSTGQDQLFIGLHLIHEVTTPQAFAVLNEHNQTVAFPNRTFATIDHIVPTANQARPFSDGQAETMTRALEENVKRHGIRYFDLASHKQGIVHVIGPELGITQPGMTIACGDSHTSTHGAFGSLAFGIGTTEVQQVLQTQTLALSPLKVRKIQFDGRLKPGVYAKDVILKIIQILGVKGGIGYAYEFAGQVFDAMTMEERMTVCNMSIEGGARIGYVNPDQTTFDYLKGREFAPKGEAFEKAKAFWASVASKSDAVFDDTVVFDGNALEPMVTWGITPGQSVGVSGHVPTLNELKDDERGVAEEAYAHMKLAPGASIQTVGIDVAFIGSCTNSRLSDLREAAKVLAGKRVSSRVKTIVVPGSQQVKAQAEAEGLHEIFKSAGAEWRDAGCSMCLAMNPDRLMGDQICASSSNRNFIGRQGSPTGRTLLMSPAMVAAAAVAGHVADVREVVS